MNTYLYEYTVDGEVVSGHIVTEDREEAQVLLDLILPEGVTIVRVSEPDE